jgi:hypothetical protein
VRAGRVLLLASAILAIPSVVAAQPDQEVMVVRAEGLTFSSVLDDPLIGAVARSGGIGLMAGERPIVPPIVTEVDLDQLAGILEASSAGEVLVIIAGTSAPEGELPPIVVARGGPAEVLDPDGRAAGLTSDTTGTEGLVADVDLVPTVAAFQGRSLPRDVPGSPIRIEGDVPTELYQRAIDYRRVATPIGLVVLALGLGSLVVGVLLLLLPVRAPVVRTSIAVLGLSSVALMVALIPASILPSLEVSAVVLGLLAIGAVLMVAALVVGRRDHAYAVAVVAGAGLLLLVLDAILGWPTEVTPLLGGGAILGVRFFGLGNSAAGVVLSGAVLVAALLRPWTGVVLVAAAALFAGLPFLGADLGGGITLFAATGLWYGWRVRDRIDLLGLGIAGAAAVLGALLLVGLHSVWPEGTHVSRAVDAGGVVETFVDRLASNLRSTTDIWPVWLTVLGLPAWLLAAWRWPGPFSRMLGTRPWWRIGVMVLAIGGMIGYVANDTFGMAAVAFAFVSAAMAYPALRERWINS